MSRQLDENYNSSTFKDSRYDWYAAFNNNYFLSVYEEVLKVVNNFRPSTRGLNAERKAKRDEDELSALNQIFSALYQSYFSIPVGIKTVSINLKEGDYKSSRFSYTAIDYVFKALKELKYIDVIAGKQGSHVTRMKHSKRLKIYFDQFGLRWLQQQPNPKETLVVLRDSKYPNHPNPKKRKQKIDLPVPETDHVQQCRENLYRINSVLTKHCFYLDLNDAQLIQLSHKMAKRKKKKGDEVEDHESARGLDLYNVQLRRIFYRGSMSKGGRLFGGWWQQLSGKYRQHIMIDGYKTAEVDYATVGIRILYAQKGIEVPLDHDMYDIGLDNWQGKNDPRRKAIKTYINAALNDETGNYRLSEKEQKSTGISHYELKAAVINAHKPIESSFNSGAGIFTQFIDANIAEQVVLRMADEDHVVLPIHDSFIVRLGYEYRLIEVMLEEFQKTTGASIGVSADYPRLRKHFGLDQGTVDSEAEDTENNIVNAAELKDLILNEEGMMYKFCSPYAS